MSDKSLTYRLAELINLKIANSEVSNSKNILKPIDLNAPNATENNQLLTDRIWNDQNNINFLRDNIVNFDLLLQITDPILYNKLNESEQKSDEVNNSQNKEEIKHKSNKI